MISQNRTSGEPARFHLSEYGVHQAFDIISALENLGLPEKLN